MPLRILHANCASSGRFPRWGYLDKFAINEYLSRAFALTIAIVAALELGYRMWPDHARPVAPVPVRPFVQAHEVTLTPPPSIVPTPPKPATVRPRIFQPIVNPRPIPVPIDDIQSFTLDTSASSGAGTGTGEVGDPLAAEGEWSGEIEDAHLVWPSPEDLIVVEHEPALVSMQTPVYPEIARLAKIEGTVLVRVLVDTEGFVRDTRVLQSVLGLDDAAVAAARTAVFRPARQQDRPVAVWVVVPIEFQLHD